MRSSAATDEYTRAERIPCVTFEITDLHQPSSSGVLTLGFSQITQGAGFTGEGVQWHRRSADQTQLHAAPCAWTTHSLRHLLSRAANVLICLMSARSIPCMSLRCLHGHPCMTGGGAHSAEADDFPPAMAVALVTWVSQMATNTIESSIPLPPRRALLLVLVFCPNDAATASMQRAMPCTRSGQARRWVRSDQLVREDRHAEEDPGVAGSGVAVEPAQKTPLISASRVLPFGRARWWALWVTPKSARRRVGSCRRQSWATAAGRWCGRPRGATRAACRSSLIIWRAICWVARCDRGRSC